MQRLPYLNDSHPIDRLHANVYTIRNGIMTRPLSPCTTPGCPHLAAYGRGLCLTCRQAKHARIDRARLNSADRGYNAEWRRKRAEQLEAFPYCAACGDVATNVDHIQPKVLLGSDDALNLQSLCQSCHSAKTMRESVQR